VALPSIEGAIKRIKFVFLPPIALLIKPRAEGYIHSESDADRDANFQLDGITLRAATSVQIGAFAFGPNNGRCYYWPTAVLG